MIKIYIFAMSATKIDSLQSNKMSNFDGQNIRQFRPIYKSSQCTKPQTTSFWCIWIKDLAKIQKVYSLSLCYVYFRM